MRAIEDSGRSVPGDIAVIGVDDVPYAALVRPGLTTMRVDISELGRIAMSRLLTLGDGGSVGPSPILRPTLVIRHSA